jgi:hypothetical protein
MPERKSRHFLRLSLWQRRALVGVVSLPLWLCVVDYFNNWRFAGEWGKLLLFPSMMASYFAITIIGPTESEMKALDRKKSSEALTDMEKNFSE